VKEYRYTVRDELGMHARPAAGFVKTARKFPCKITVAKHDKEADAKQIFAVMELELCRGEEMILRAEGSQEEEAIAALGGFLEKNL